MNESQVKMAYQLFSTRKKGYAYLRGTYTRGGGTGKCSIPSLENVWHVATLKCSTYKIVSQVKMFDNDLYLIII